MSYYLYVLILGNFIFILCFFDDGVFVFEVIVIIIFFNDNSEVLFMILVINLSLIMLLIDVGFNILLGEYCLERIKWIVDVIIVVKGVWYQIKVSLNLLQNVLVMFCFCQCFIFLMWC